MIGEDTGKNPFFKTLSVLFNAQMIFRSRWRPLHCHQPWNRLSNGGEWVGDGCAHAITTSSCWSLESDGLSGAEREMLVLWFYNFMVRTMVERVVWTNLAEGRDLL